MAYKMTHPETKREIEVDAQYVAMYESQGWETKPTAPAPKPKPDEK